MNALNSQASVSEVVQRQNSSIIGEFVQSNFAATSNSSAIAGSSSGISGGVAEEALQHHALNSSITVTGANQHESTLAAASQATLQRTRAYLERLKHERKDLHSRNDDIGAEEPLLKRK